jgi:hypothetical protein
VFVSQSVDGVIYVAHRSLNGSAKFLWSAIEVASDQNDDSHALKKSGLTTLTGNAC